MALCNNQCYAWDRRIGNPGDSNEIHLYTPGILTWSYRVILILANSDIEFCTNVGVDPGECGGF